MERLQWKELLCAKRPKEIFAEMKSSGDNSAAETNENAESSMAKSKSMENSEAKFFACFPEEIQAFMQDYTSITDSSYFRRLQDKTQVFTLEENDFVRTRLTHSVEVASIAEKLGILIGYELEERQEEDLGEKFVERLSLVLRCVGLLHDLGNPPFGHGGEEYIREYFKSCKEKNPEDLLFKYADTPQEYAKDSVEYYLKQMGMDLLHFEGNAQSVRIVTKHAQNADPDVSNYGMNLTAAILNGLIKYPWNSTEISKSRKKMGYYFSEEWIMKAVFGEHGCHTKRVVDGKEIILKNPVMLLMEAADDIAYGTADLEDAIKNNMMSFEQLCKLFPDHADQGKTDDEFSWSELIADVRAGKDFEEKFKILQDGLKIIRMNWINYAKEQFFDHYQEIMEGTYEGELAKDYPGFPQKVISGFFKTDVYQLRDQYCEDIYNSKLHLISMISYLSDVIQGNAAEKRLEKKFILEELKQFAEKTDREYKVACKHFPKDMRDEEKRILTTEMRRYYNYLMVTDYVSGMTDGYVQIFYEKLFSKEFQQEKLVAYKRQCLEDLFLVPLMNGFDKAADVLERIQLVAEEHAWTDREKWMILQTVFERPYSDTGMYRYHQILEATYGEDLHGVDLIGRIFEEVYPEATTKDEGSLTDAEKRGKAYLLKAQGHLAN